MARELFHWRVRETLFGSTNVTVAAFYAEWVARKFYAEHQRAVPGIYELQHLTADGWAPAPPTT